MDKEKLRRDLDDLNHRMMELEEVIDTIYSYEDVDHETWQNIEGLFVALKNEFDDYLKPNLEYELDKLGE